MTVLVNWPGAVAIGSGLIVLLGLAWLLRGERGVMRACFAVAIGVIVIGLAAGNVVALAAGAAMLAVDCWCLMALRELRRRQ